MRNEKQSYFSQAIIRKGYEIERQLAKKAGRRTLLARDVNSQELVVIKLLAFSNDFSWEDLKLFEREAQTLQTLQHPAIPRYVDYFELNTNGGKTYALVQSYIEGESLEEHLQAKGKFTEAEIYGYMPPEQFGGRCVAASDLYSLGATLIFLITGLHPTELPQKDLQIQFRQTANFSEEFADWLEWMTEPSLSQRFKSTQEAIKALENPVPRQKTISLSKQKLQKPPDSEIKLHKYIDGLEIVIPPQGFRLAQIALISLISPFAIGFDLFSFSEVYSAEITKPTYLMQQHIVQTFGVIFLLIIILWALFKRTRLRISKDRISFIYELLGIKWKFSQQKFLKNRHNLKLTPPSFIEHWVQPLSVMNADSEEFCLSNYANFTPEELEWLEQEISDYLDMPISKF